MGNKNWKRIEQSNGFRRAKLKYKQLLGKEPKLKIDRELKTINWGGWQLVANLVEQGNIIYSYGISDDIEFELAACRIGAHVYAFDPTPYCIEWIAKQELPNNFEYFPWAAAGSDGHFYLYPRIKKRGKKSSVMYTFEQQGDEENQGVKVRALSLNSTIKELGHKNIDILKMDIEGAEYDVVDCLLQSVIRPKMILIEFHHRFKNIGKEKTINAISGLRDAGYLLSSISSTGREFCLVHESAIDNC
jgi:FkbM family methyltransferase